MALINEGSAGTSPYKPIVKPKQQITREQILSKLPAAYQRSIQAQQGTPVQPTPMENKFISGGSPQGGVIGKALIERRIGQPIMVTRETPPYNPPRPPRIEPQQQIYARQYAETPEFQEYIRTPQGQQQLLAIQQSEAERRLTTPDTYKFSIPFLGTWDTGIKQPEWTAKYNISTVTVYNPEEARLKLAQNIIDRGDVYSGLATRTRLSRSFGEAGLRAITWPITLPQTAIKYFTGTGSATDVLGRINTGKTLFLPDVSKGISERTVAPTTGAIEGTISTFISGGKYNYLENLQKYPVESVFAGATELMGLYAGGKMVQTAKATTYRGLGYARQGIIKTTGFKVPGYEKISYYFPQRVFRRAWVKAGTTDIDKMMGTTYHTTKTLTPGGLSFAVGKTTGRRISWTLEQAGKSRGLKYSEGDILLGSSGTSRIGRSFYVKPKVLHELPSISTTPYGYVPTRFYRFSSPDVNYSSSISLLPKMNTPTGLVTRIEKLFKPPKGSYEDIGIWAKAQPKGRWGVIGPKMYLGGPETEINIFGKTTLKRYLPDTSTLFQRFKGYQYYSRVPLESGKFEVVPTVFTKIVHKGFPSNAKLLLESDKIRGIKEFLSPYSSTGKSTTSILSFGSMSSMLSRSYTVGSSSPSISSYPSKPSISSYVSKMYSSFGSSPSSIISKSSSIASVSRSISKSISSMSSSISPSSPSSIPSHISTPSYPIPYYNEDYYYNLKSRSKGHKMSIGYRYRHWNMPKLEDYFGDFKDFHSEAKKEINRFKKSMRY